MKKLESSLKNMLLVLVGVAIIAGALLAWVNKITAAPIAGEQAKELQDGIRQVMCAKDLKVSKTDTTVQQVGEKELTFLIYNVEDVSGNALGAAVESTTMGFGGDLRVLVGFSSKGTILGYTILQSSETPGLGAKAGQWFQKGQKGDIIGREMKPGSELTVRKDGGDVDAITASTITSRAFLKAVNQAYAAFNATPIDAATGASKQQ